MFFQYIAQNMLEQVPAIALVFYSIVGWNHNKAIAIVCAAIITPYYFFGASSLISSEFGRVEYEIFIWRFVGLAIGIIGGAVWKKYVQPLARNWENSDK